MITLSNIKEIIESLDKEQKKLLNNTDKEYIEIEVSISNAGFKAFITPTNVLDNLEELASEGNCILERSDSVFDDFN